ncbi:MAG: undecaprenyl-diphosphate phosphatase, partial [Gemmatimonadetes bacterium]|nr:undecaprenyl-diphosphate phosphatase [Gemmatimonadota bacterium]
APAIAGAAILSLKDGVPAGGFAWGPGVLGMLAAALAGWIAIRLLVRMVISGRFDRWGYYCLGAAAAGWFVLA